MKFLKNKIVYYVCTVCGSRLWMLSSFMRIYCRKHQFEDTVCVCVSLCVYVCMCVCEYVFA